MRFVDADKGSDMTTTTDELNEASEAGRLLFAQVRLESGCFRLRAATDVQSDATAIIALANGQVIGRSTQSVGDQALEPGSWLDIRCRHFPKLPLPVEIRFAVEGGDDDVAPPFTISTEDQILRLVGPASLRDVSLTISEGVVHGEGTVDNNNLLKPSLIGRVNGLVLREVSVSETIEDASGNARISFQMPINATDLTGSGILIEFVSLPEMKILASRTFAPLEGVSALAGRLSELEVAVEQVRRQRIVDMARLIDMLDERDHDRTFQMDRAFEYMLTLLQDTLNRDASASPDTTEHAHVAALRELLTKQGVLTEKRRKPPRDVVNPTSPAFMTGWYPTEIYSDGRPFRWMGRGAVIDNPRPAERVRRVSLHVLMVFGGSDVRVRAFFDRTPAVVHRVETDGGGPFIIDITAQDDDAVYVGRVDLVSETAENPKRIGVAEDDRILSMAVVEARFDYEDETDR